MDEQRKTPEESTEDAERVPCEPLLDGLIWNWVAYAKDDPIVMACYRTAKHQEWSQVQFLEFMALHLMTAKQEVERAYRRALDRMPSGYPSVLDVPTKAV